MRLSGTARRREGGPAGALLRRIVVDGKKAELGRLDLLSELVIELEDGSRLPIEPSKTIVLAPELVKESRWKEATGEDLAEIVWRKRRPDPEAKVVITRATLDEGEPIEIYAEDAEYTFQESAGHRSAPERKLLRMTALILTSGPDAKEEIERLIAERAAGAPNERRKPKTKSNRAPVKHPGRDQVSRFLTGYRIAGVSALLLLAMAALLPFSPLAVDLVCVAVGLASAIAATWGFARVPRFVKGQAAIGARRDQPFFAAMMAVLPLSLWTTFAFMDLKTPWQKVLDGHSPTNASLLSCVSLVLWCIVLFIALLHYTQRSARLLRTALDAEPLPSGTLRTWGSFEGVVRDPTPVTAAGEATAIAHVLEETVVEGSDPNKVVERVLSAGTFFADNEDLELEIDPTDASWASSVTLHTQATIGGALRHDHTQVIPLGGSVLVAGFAVRSKKSSAGRISRSGAEPLILFAADRGESARQVAGRILRARLIALGLILACGGCGVLLIRHAEARLPPLSIPESGD